MAWEELEKSGIKAYYEDDAVFIINADCREVLPTLEKVDLVQQMPANTFSIFSDYYLTGGSGQLPPNPKILLLINSITQRILGEYQKLTVEKPKRSNDQKFFKGSRSHSP